ncbi:MAG: response regulator transcription factor [Clostridium sp.]|uniref:response regulator transcription factor n=1 Tax=Clostridium sp. TaxID=1506 RepID=UPI00291570EE|nr:response regulator transcription factor [Clostridium sp.]MDU7336638.1 response regulator transcription factor [Clostridium sp.]
MARLLIVEDDPDTNDSICEYLKGAGHQVHAAFDGQQALGLFESFLIDAIVLDIMLPKLSGMEVLREIRRNNNVPVLMLTAIRDEQTQIASFDRLADDYITKPCSIVLLGKRITALLRRAGKGKDVRSWGWQDLVVDFSAYTVYKENKPVDVAQKELQLLKLLIDNQGLVLTRNQILDELWGLESPESDRTIDLYISRLRNKLGIDCIKTIKGIGYKLEGSE